MKGVKMTITKPIYVDVVRKSLFPEIVAKQGDLNSRFLKIIFQNDGVQIFIENTNTVQINATRPDGESDSFNGTINQDGTVTVPLTQWMLALAGTVSCDVSVTSEDFKLTTATFRIGVEKASYTGSAISPEEE